MPNYKGQNKTVGIFNNSNYQMKERNCVSYFFLFASVFACNCYLSSNYRNLIFFFSDDIKDNYKMEEKKKENCNNTTSKNLRSIIAGNVGRPINSILTDQINILCKVSISFEIKARI